MTTYDNLTASQKIRASLHRDCRGICTETCHLLGLEITKPAMEIIAELVYKKMSVYGSDLEAFAKHAKRTTINSEDVKLLARRNPSLKSHLNSIAPSIQPAAKEKRRKTILPVAKQQETANAKGNDSPRTDSPKGKDIPKVKDHLKDKDEIEKNRTKIADFVEDMVLDDPIDLTFD